jgi:hypothetical protein
MVMLEQHESFEPIDGSFLYPDAIEVEDREKRVAQKLLQLTDTVRLCEAVTETAEFLSRPQLKPELRSIEQVNLEEMLADLRTELLQADVVGVDFSHRLTSYSSAYVNLLKAFGVAVGGEGSQRVMIPADNICAVQTLPGKASESFFTPQVLMRAKTGEELPRSVIEDGSVTQIPGEARWFNFPLQHSVFSVYGYVRPSV